ncbi:MAG: hypothetical protein KDG54_20485, partial [Geminicoccaceae bacterium]|nr:hypothetical protein [Geminicoccaceae bacterium]
MTTASPRRTPSRTFRPWPRGLAGQTIALLLLALVGAQVATTVLFFDERRQAVLLATQNQVFGRIASVARLLRDTP